MAGGHHQNEWAKADQRHEPYERVEGEDLGATDLGPAGECQYPDRQQPTDIDDEMRSLITQADEMLVPIPQRAGEAHQVRRQ